MEAVFAIYADVNVGNGPELAPWGLLAVNGDWEGGLDTGSAVAPGAAPGDDWFFGASWWVINL